MSLTKVWNRTGSLAGANARSRPLLGFFRNLTPAQLLVTGYFSLVVLFTVLLMLPLATADHRPLAFTDAFFISSSGISTTGLTPVNVGSRFSLFGQVVLLLDFQVGGIGYMAIAVMLAGVLKRRLSLKSQMVAGESMAGSGWNGHFRFFKKVIAFTLAFEISGGILLTACWLHRYPFLEALYKGFFHSISAFCTAGFSVFQDSLTLDRNNVAVNAVIIVLSWFGSIGFLALAEMTNAVSNRLGSRKRLRLSTHTRLCLSVSFLLMFLGTLLIFISGGGAAGRGFFQRFLSSSFQAVSAHTTDGFNTLNVAGMSATSAVLFILLMLIGASPGGTGGGIKTTTLGVIVLEVRRQLAGRRDCNFRGRQIPDETVRKAMAILFLFILVLGFDVLVLQLSEKSQPLPLIFESASALGNTGLSMGATPGLSGIGKLLLSLTMFIGRVGPLTLGLAMLKSKKDLPYHYPEATLQVG